MQLIIKFGLTKASISSTLHTAVIYGPQYLGVIGLFDFFVIQGAIQIAFLIEHCWKKTPSSSLLCANLSTLQLETLQGGNILEKNHHETQRWLHTESWIRKV